MMRRCLAGGWVLMLLACGGSDDGTEPGVATDAGGAASVADGQTGGEGGTGVGSGGGVTGGDDTGGGAGGESPGAGDPSSGAGGAISPVEPEPVTCRNDGDGTTTVVIVNGCSKAITFAGSDIPGGTVEPGGHSCVDIGSDEETLSAQRYWAWVGEDPGGGRHTLAEFTFNTDFNDFDWYNISHVDAHNLPMQIVPVGRDNCDTLTCATPFLETCPEAGQYRDSSGRLASCVSLDRDDPTNPVAVMFETCDDGYAWSLDDHEGDDPSPVRACAGEDWDIVFCPEAS